MATKTLTLTGTTTYTDEFSTTQQPAIVASTTYQTVNSGQIDIPSGTTAATSYELPMVGISVVRGLRLSNGSGQELDIKYNGVTASYGIPSSGLEIKCFPSDADNPITAITLVTTESPSVADGVIDYAVFGD